MQIEVKGLEEAKKILIQLLQFANNQHMQDIMQTIGQMIRNKTEEAFSDKKSPFSKRWEPLNPSTLKVKKGKGDILRFTGSLQDRWNIEATNSKVIVSGNSAKTLMLMNKCISLKLLMLEKIKILKFLQGNFYQLIIVVK